MKKLTIIAAFALLYPFGAKNCLADYQNMASQVETVANFWVGGYYNDSSSSINPGLAADYNLIEENSRVGSNKATEWYSTTNSASGGFLYKSSPLPSRVHLEFDYYNNNDFFGDFRQSYKDVFQVRFLPRRFVHNLDNLTIYDFNPTVSNYDPLTDTYNTNGNDVQRYDKGIDDYSLRTDIDDYRVRLKTPNFPLHIYSEGEIVRRLGTEQLRFLGGSASSNGRQEGTGSGSPSYTEGRVRVTEARNIDQDSKEFTVGTSAHLGPIEMDISHKTRKFENELAQPVYSYEVAPTAADPNPQGGQVVNVAHNVIPDLKEETNTFKIHTSHTGRLFASATYSEIDKTNEYSGAEAENDMSYGEVTWLPVAYLSITTKVRHQKNDATAPETVQGINLYGEAMTYIVNPGVASKTDTGNVSVRYSLIPKTNLTFLYTKKIKTVDDQSAIDWAIPAKQVHDTYELGFTNWVIPKVRITAKLQHIHVGTDFGLGAINNEPEETNMGNLGIAWTITPKLSAFLQASASKDTTEDNRMVVTSVVNNVINNAMMDTGHNGDDLQEMYLASCSYQLTQKFSITPTYTYMSYKQKRDLNFESGVDPNYKSAQKSQNFALNLMYVPISSLTFNTSVDYTLSHGDFMPTVAGWEEVAMFSDTHSDELNVRFDTNLDLGRGWGVGLDLRYEDWKDTSADNPSNGTFLGGLFKISKKLYY